jgi:hypothetical protein
VFNQPRGELVDLASYRNQRAAIARASMGDGFVSLQAIPDGESMDLAVACLQCIAEAARTGRALSAGDLLLGGRRGGAA